MEVTVKIYGGAYRSEPTKQDVQKNIDALQRAIDGKLHANDFALLIDTMSIMRAIQKQLPAHKE